MKKAILAAFAVCAALVSCSKEDDFVPGDSTVVIKLPDNVVYGERSVEDQVPDKAETTVILNVKVFLLNGTAVVQKGDFLDSEITAKYKRMEQVPSTVNNVILIANYPDDQELNLNGCTTASQIKQYPFNVVYQNSTDGITDKTLIGEGVPVTIQDPNPDGHDYKGVTVSLSAITARMEIGAVKPGKGIAKIELVGVWLNKFYSVNSGEVISYAENPATMIPPLPDYWSTDPATTTSPSKTVYDNVSILTSYSPSQYQTPGSVDVNLNPDSKVYAYHVFAGANIPHLLLLVKGEYAEEYYSGTEKYFLQWVTYTKYKENDVPITEMKGNYIYKIGVGSTGIEVTPDILTTKPEQTPFDLGINVVIVQWTAANVVPSL